MNEAARPLLLFVVNVPWFFVSHRLPIARAARDAGYDVQIACATDAGVDVLEAEGFQLHFLPMSRSGLALPGELWALYRLYRRLKPALVHHVTIKPVILGSLAARLARVSAVVNALPGLGFVFVSQGRLGRMRRALVMAAYRLVLRRRGTRVIFQNGDDRTFFESHGLVDSHQSVLIRGSGVDLQQFSPQPEPDGEVTVGLVSRMLRDKGIEEFVEAARILHGRGQLVRMILVGAPDEGNPTAIPTARLDSWVRDGEVEWWGFKTDIAAVMATLNVVCLPSYREGLPKVLLEAAASGRAIVTTDVPGCREVVSDGDNGILVPVRDAAALADALAYLAGEPELRARMGRRGRERAEQEFGVEQVIARTLDVYQEVLDS